MATKVADHQIDTTIHLVHLLYWCKRTTMAYTASLEPVVISAVHLPWGILRMLLSPSWRALSVPPSCRYRCPSTGSPSTARTGTLPWRCSPTAASPGHVSYYNIYNILVITPQSNPTAGWPGSCLSASSHTHPLHLVLLMETRKGHKVSWAQSTPSRHPGSCGGTPSGPVI